LPVVLGIVSLGLAVALFMTKQGGDAQHATDSAAILDVSNQLSAAQAGLTASSATLATLSNSLDQCQSASLTLSNTLSGQLANSQSALNREAEQIASLNTKVTEMDTASQAASQHTAELASQVTTLTKQLTQSQADLASTKDSLARANTDYSLLEDRFRIDVAERLVMQRKFYNQRELQKQLENLRNFPTVEVTPGMIYAGLDVRVESNGKFHVISPN
jgi:chromosome segregation ATPase